MNEVVLHVDDDQRAGVQIDVDGLRGGGNPDDALLFSWAHKAHGLLSGGRLGAAGPGLVANLR